MGKRFDSLVFPGGKSRLGAQVTYLMNGIQLSRCPRGCLPLY